MLEKLARLIDGVVGFVAGTLAAVLLLYSGYVLYDNFNTNRNAFSSWDLLQYKPVGDLSRDAGYQELLSINPDVVGWLTLYDTDIDYPILQGADNMEYVNKDVYGNFSLSGAIYLAAECAPDFSDEYSLIYGHHMDNGAMFGGIDEFAAPDYFSGHRFGLIQTLEGNFDLRHYVRVMGVGLMLEIGVAGAAGYLFYITEDFRRNMVILDRWTPCMIGLFALALLVDFICFRYRGSRPKEDSVTDEQSENDANA